MDREWIQAPSEEDSRKMEEIIIIGGGRHARVVISIIKKLNKYNIRGYTDPRNCGELLGAPYLGTDNELSNLTSGSQMNNAVLAVGQIGLGKSRHDIYRRLGSLRL